MIIWGWQTRHVEQEAGGFHCPRCRRGEDYRYYRVATYFTLYFIPLFETSHHGDFVRCDGCGGEYAPDVLDDRPPRDDLRRVRKAVRAELRRGTPVETVRAELVKAGMPAWQVKPFVRRLAGEPLLSCRDCGLTFIDGTDRCSACGGPLG